MSTGPGRPLPQVGGNFRSLIIGTAAATGVYLAYYLYQREKHRRMDEPTYLHRELKQPTAKEMGTPRVTGTVRDRDVRRGSPAKPQGA